MLEVKIRMGMGLTLRTVISMTGGEGIEEVFRWAHCNDLPDYSAVNSRFFIFQAIYEIVFFFKQVF